MASPRQLIRRLGFDVARYPIHTTLHGHLRGLLKSLGATVVLDVGANAGQFGRGLRSEGGFSGRIVSFEPFPGSLAELDRAAKNDPAWTSLPFALGDVDGVARLRSFEGSDWNSLHEPDHENLAISGRSITSTGAVDVQVRRLETLWPDLAAPDDVVFLKSDTQGHDLQVLAGAGPRLDEVVGLLVEASILPFYEDEPVLADMLTAMSDLGFTPTGFFPVSRQKGSSALTTVDVCLVRS